MLAYYIIFTGVLFKQTAITLASAVIISSFVALSLSPMLGSKFLKKNMIVSLMIKNLQLVELRAYVKINLETSLAKNSLSHHNTAIHLNNNYIIQILQKNGDSQKR